MNTKYSSNRARVTKEWAAQCPGFRVWKPKHIFRIHGPLIMGVCLDSVRSDDAFQPSFHFHSLMSTSDYITLRLKGPLLSKLGAVLEIKVSTYEEKKKDIVERLIQQYPLIGYTRPLRYRQFLQTVANVMTGRHGPGRDYLPYVYRDVVLLAAYSGEVEFACRELEKFYADLRQRNDYNMRIIGTLEQWRTDIERALEQSKLKERVASEISKFDLLEFQDFGFEFDEEVSLFEVIQRASQG